MRKVTRETVSAFINRRERSVDNTDTDGQSLFLHGNRIAWHGEHNGAIGVFMTLCGWGTPTTRERLNGILSEMGHRSPPGRPVLGFHQHQHDQWIGAWGAGFEAVNREISTTAIVFVVYPSTAHGINAVHIISE